MLLRLLLIRPGAVTWERKKGAGGPVLVTSCRPQCQGDMQPDRGYGQGSRSFVPKLDETPDVVAVRSILLNLSRTGSASCTRCVGIDMRGRSLPVSEGRCDHSYPILLTATEAGSYYYATCLGCLASGPPRSSCRAAHQALKEGLERLHKSSSPHLFGL